MSNEKNSAVKVYTLPVSDRAHQTPQKHPSLRYGAIIADLLAKIKRLLT